MTDHSALLKTALEHRLTRPRFSTDEDGVIQAESKEPDTLRIFNVQAVEVGSGLMTCVQDVTGRSDAHHALKHMKSMSLECNRPAGRVRANRSMRGCGILPISIELQKR